MIPAPHERPLPGPAADLAAALAVRLPVLETPRCILRAPRLTDFPVRAAILCGPRFDGGGPVTRDDAFGAFALYAAQWLLRGHGLWTVALRDGDAVAGFVLIGMEPGDREPELGRFAADGFEGRGLLAEAAAAARDHARARLRLPALVSYIDPANTRSLRLAARLGARADGTVDGALVLRHLPEAAA